MRAVILRPRLPTPRPCHSIARGGLRYDLRDGGVVKASYNWWWLDSGGKSDDISLDAFRIEYGWRF